MMRSGETAPDKVQRVWCFLSAGEREKLLKPTESLRWKGDEASVSGNKHLCGIFCRDAVEETLLKMT